MEDETFWAVDCEKDVPSADGKLRFVLAKKSADGEITFTGDVRVSDVAPSKKVQILGFDYESAKDWMDCYAHILHAAVERCQEGSPR